MIPTGKKLPIPQGPVVPSGYTQDVGGAEPPLVPVQLPLTIGGFQYTLAPHCPSSLGTLTVLGQLSVNSSSTITVTV